MKRLGLVLIAGSLLLGGCATTRMVEEHEIVDHDPGQTAYDQQEGSTQAEPTPDHVVVADKDGILIDVNKIEPIYLEEHKVDLQQWEVLASNMNRKDKCVGVIWRLMDFRFESNHPTDVLIPAHQGVILGHMIQTTMVIDGVTVAPDPSGYIQAMRIKNPRDDAIEGEECLYLVDEDDVVVGDDD